MTEKRFRLLSPYDEDIGHQEYFISDDLEKKKYDLFLVMSIEELVDLLNELNDEKDELKRNYDLCVHRRMNDHNEVHRLEEENKELKAENKKLKQSYNIFFGKINNSISRLYHNRSITFDERAFYLRKVRELKEELQE